MAVTTAVTILVFCCTAASVVSQEVGCSSLNSPYVWSNLGNLSVGISDIQQLRDLALQPLLAQPRIPGTAGSRLARTHIKTWMSAAGWTVEEDSFYDAVPWPYGTRFFSNVIATLNPDRSRRVVLACHYDTKVLPGARFVGAIDSAVPCALLLDSAVRLSDVFRTARDSVSDLTVQFIFFDGEEAFVSWGAQDSLYGARHLANNWASKPDPNSQGLSYLQSIETFILLDLIGTPDTEFKLRFRETASVYSKLLNIERCLKTRGHLKPTQNTNPIFNSQEDHHAVDDDHAPFYNRGVPVVHLITYPFSSVWHTPADDVSALDFDRIENLARILRVFLADLPL